MVYVKYSIKILLIILIVLNAVNIIPLLVNRKSETLLEKSVLFVDSQNQIKEFVRPLKDEISLNFNIVDISRIDISCEYITRDLDQKIPKNYRILKRRSCAVASLRPGLDTILKYSVRTDYKDNKRYKPTFDPKSFQPFDSQTPLVKTLDFFKSLQPGGDWRPNHLNDSKLCTASHLEHIVFIVPFSRDRNENLKLFLLNIHSYLQTAEFKFRYTILVVEQGEPGLFNKGQLLNAAFDHVNTKYPDVDCIVIHDVDLVPAYDSRVLKERGDYRCRQMPWHMTNKVFLMVSNSSRVYNDFLTGGILSLRPQHIIDSNGFSNKFFGWGAEDDDFTLRMFRTHLCIMRPSFSQTPTKTPEQDAPFIMLNHAPSKRNKKRGKTLVDSFWTHRLDGLNNVKNLTQIGSVVKYPTFTHLLVNFRK